MPGAERVGRGTFCDVELHHTVLRAGPLRSQRESAALFAFRTKQHRRWPQDKKESADDFIKSPVLGALTLREAKDVVRMVGDDEFGVERPEIKEAVSAAVSSETAKL